MANYRISVGEATHEITTATADALDLISVGENRYHLIHAGESLEVNLLEINLVAKTVTLSVANREFKVVIADEYDQLVASMGLSAVVEQRLTSVPSPMPGLVLDVLVNPGDTVEKGDKLLILEAMKMENIIKATGQGVVKEVLTQKGEAVEKGQLLIEME